jgi:hypothetical protein
MLTVKINKWLDLKVSIVYRYLRGKDQIKKNTSILFQQKVTIKFIKNSAADNFIT